MGVCDSGVDVEKATSCHLKSPCSSIFFASSALSVFYGIRFATRYFDSFITGVTLMKKRITLVLTFGLLTLFTALHVGCGKEGLLQNLGLSNGEITDGLRTALDTAARNASGLGSKVDGFLKNELIRLALPKELEPVLKLRDMANGLGLLGNVASVPLSSAIDKFTTSLNRAAEASAGKAFPVFKEAITGMTITDGLGILQGGDTAATHYLRNKTTQGLMEAFKPVCKQMIDQVEVTKYYGDLASAYNTAMPVLKRLLRVDWSDFPEQLNVDLPTYVTDRSIHGMFVLMRGEEQKIRENPLGYASDIIQKVFNSKEAKTKQ